LILPASLADLPLAEEGVSREEIINFQMKNKMMTRVQSVLNSKETGPQVLYGDMYMSPTDFVEHKIEFVYEPATKQVVISFFRNENIEKAEDSGTPADGDMDAEPIAIAHKTH
jgi:hypothetical protein